MINEERLRLMTKAALMENKSGEEFRINRYFKKDYVAYHIILIWFGISVAYALIAVAAAVVYIEKYPEKAQNANLEFILVTLGMIYLIVAVLYVLISMLVYARRYDKAMIRIRKYGAVLKLLEKSYMRDGADPGADSKTKSGAPAKTEKKKAEKKRGGLT